MEQSQIITRIAEILRKTYIRAAYKGTRGLTEATEKFYVSLAKMAKLEINDIRCVESRFPEIAITKSEVGKRNKLIYLGLQTIAHMLLDLFEEQKSNKAAIEKLLDKKNFSSVPWEKLNFQFQYKKVNEDKVEELKGEFNELMELACGLGMIHLFNDPTYKYHYYNVIAL